MFIFEEAQLARKTLFHTGLHGAWNRTPSHWKNSISAWKNFFHTCNHGILCKNSEWFWYNNNSIWCT